MYSVCPWNLGQHKPLSIEASVEANSEEKECAALGEIVHENERYAEQTLPKEAVQRGVGNDCHISPKTRPGRVAKQAWVGGWHREACTMIPSVLPLWAAGKGGRDASKKLPFAASPQSNPLSWQQRSTNTLVIIRPATAAASASAAASGCYCCYYYIRTAASKKGRSTWTSKIRGWYGVWISPLIPSDLGTDGPGYYHIFYSSSCYTSAARLLSDPPSQYQK